MSKPKSSQPQNPVPPEVPRHSPLGVFLAFALVASVVLAAWEIYDRLLVFIEDEASRERLIGDLRIAPQGHVSTSLFQHSWTKIRIEMPGLEVDILDPAIALHLFDDLSREMIQVKARQVNADIYPSRFIPSNRKAAKHWSHGDFWLPFRGLVEIARAQISVENIGSWSIDTLRVGNPGQKNLAVGMRRIEGTYVASPTSLRLRYQWSREFADASLRIRSTHGDSLWVSANAPRQRLEDLSGELTLHAENPRRWVPRSLPPSVPGIGASDINASFAVNPIAKRFSYKIDATTATDAYWQLPPLKWKLGLAGDQKLEFDAEVEAKGKPGQQLSLKAHVDRKLDGIAQGKVEGFPVQLASFHLPMDGTIHRVIKTGDSLHATITSAAGSEIVGTMKGFHSPRFQFMGNIAPNEPWAVTWTHGNVILAPPILIEGGFERGILSANVKAKVPYAYYAMAESFETDLTLSHNGIQFDNGAIFTRGHLHSFNGEVVWNDSIPHFEFSLEQDQDRFAHVYGTFDADIDLSLAGIRIENLPWADTTLLHGYGGSVTGLWKHSFHRNEGEAQVAIETEVRNIPLRLRANAYQSGDSLILERLVVNHGNNQLEAKAKAQLVHDTTITHRTTVELLGVKVTTRDFNLPDMIAALGDSTLTSGSMSGEVLYNGTTGLSGGLVFQNMTLRQLDSTQLAIPRLRLFTAGNTLQLAGRIKAGKGLWDGEAEITLDSIFTRTRHRLAGAFVSDNGGLFWFEGKLDSTFKRWLGELHFNGSWFLPSGAGEIRSTDLSAKIDANLTAGLPGIKVEFGSEKTEYSLGTIFSLPIQFNGKLENGILDVAPIVVSNDSGQTVEGQLRFDIANGQLEEILFHSDRYTLPFQSIHKITVEDLSGNTEVRPDGIKFHLQAPIIRYHLKDKDIGDATALVHAEFDYRIPRFANGSLMQTNSSIDGNVFIDKAVYRKVLDIAPDPLHLDRTFSTIARMLASIRKERPVSKEGKAAAGRPTNLNIRITDSGRDSLMVMSNLATFPFAVDLKIGGTTQTPLLNGDINAVGSGFIGFERLATFEISSLRLYWLDVPWRKGIIDVQSSHDFPFCEDDPSSDETCPVAFDITGTLLSPQPAPSANCGIESSPALIYYSILLGCVSQNYQSYGLDKNKLTGKLLGNLLATTANKGLGGDYIGDVDLKMRIFDNASAQEKDSSYLRIPVSLDRWVRNLSMVFGYTQDQSENPRYDQSMELGLQYSLPIFDPNETNMNLIDPRLDLSSYLVARRYPATVEARSENRVEKNIGLLYTYRFWDPCILGIGRCAPLEKAPPPPLRSEQH